MAKITKKEHTKRWHKNNPEYIKQWRKNNPERMKKYNKQKLEYKYNLTHEDWLAIWDNQDGKCTICGKLFENPSDACVDHSHETDEIRGLLCRQCNAALGLFKDDVKILNNAIEYLGE